MSPYRNVLCGVLVLAFAVASPTVPAAELANAERVKIVQDLQALVQDLKAQLAAGSQAADPRPDQRENLLRELRRALGGIEQLIMRLELTPEAVAVMIEAFDNRDHDAAFRSELIMRLCKERYVGPHVKRALRDPEADVRRAAAEAVAKHGSFAEKGLLIDSLDDPDLIVRRTALGLYADGDLSYYERLTAEERDALLIKARDVLEGEGDPEARFLARQVIGRRVSALCDKARQQLQGEEPLGPRHCCGRPSNSTRTASRHASDSFVTTLLWGTRKRRSDLPESMTLS